MPTSSLLLADSGATKTTWYWLDQEQQQQWTTSGCQPYYRTTEELINGLSQSLLPQLPTSAPPQVWFYGAGCGNPTAKATVENALLALFPRSKIEVEGDVLGAARATAQQEAGICCILGTGSASCYYDGAMIADQVPSLGYILGDQGGGAALGRQLLQAYFYRHLPLELKHDFERRYQPDRHAIITQVLSGAEPSRYLASYALFAADWKAHPFIQGLVLNNFGAFLDGQIQPYAQHQQLPIHAVGSIAHGFSTLWRQAITQRGWQVGAIYKSPFPALLEYHRANQI